MDLSDHKNVLAIINPSILNLLFFCWISIIKYKITPFFPLKLKNL